MEYCIYTYLKTLAKFEPHNNYRTRLSPMHGKNKSHTKHKTLKSHVFGMVLLIQESPVVGKVLFLVCQSFSHLIHYYFHLISSHISCLHFFVDVSKIQCIKDTKIDVISLKWHFFLEQCVSLRIKSLAKKYEKYQAWSYQNFKDKPLGYPPGLELPFTGTSKKNL